MADLTKSFGDYKGARGYRLWLSKWYPGRQFETVIDNGRFIVRQKRG